jgi:hypothetical protein
VNWPQTDYAGAPVLGVPEKEAARRATAPPPAS